MKSAEEKAKYQKEVKILDVTEEFDSCAVCRDRNTDNLIVVQLPVSRNTMCNECAKDLADKINAGIKQ